jgi:NAD-dependent deacetylase
MEVASLSAFRYNPARFYNWLRPFVKNLIQAEPNPAHESLAELEQAGFIKSIITQNIDGLHQKAGSSAVIEVHGTLQTLSCPGCFRQIAASDELVSSIFENDYTPTCEQCGKILKPDIILYEEQLPANKWSSARNEILNCDLLLVLGSSLTVTPVCDLPYSAMAHGAKTIIINRTSTHLDSQAVVSLQGELADLVPLIANKVIHAQ